jgi:hypothetical protein
LPCYTSHAHGSHIAQPSFSDRLLEAIESHGREKPRLQPTVSEVYAPSMIKARIIVQPLTTDERNDPAKLTQNYLEVIKKVVENDG